MLLQVPSITLRNAAQPNTQMPIVGLGTGGYGDANGNGGMYSCLSLIFFSSTCSVHLYKYAIEYIIISRLGEYWGDEVAEQATAQWLSIGGRRIDTSLSYGDQTGIGNAIKASGIPRGMCRKTRRVKGDKWNKKERVER